MPSRGGEQWLAAVWVRDLDGRRRLVQARRPDRDEAERALAERMALRRPLGFRGVEPTMTVAELGEYWMRRRREEARGITEPSNGGLGVSPQTLAGYQTALSRIINPNLGGLLLVEARTGVVDEVLSRVDRGGRSTRVARSVLTQMFAMAVRHDALATSPMREVRSAPRRRRDVRALTVEQARDLLALLQVDHRRQAARERRNGPRGGRRRTPDLHDVVLLLLASGLRVGEALALEWADIELEADVPQVRVAATLIEPRRDAATGQVFVPGLQRQPMTKTGVTRVLALPDAAVEMLQARVPRKSAGRHVPVFPHAKGGWLWPNNVRTKLRGVVADTELAGVTPHTLRRTVGTLVAHAAGLDAARTVLGHRDPSVTARHYVADTGVPIDVRHLLARLFA